GIRDKLVTGVHTCALPICPYNRCFTSGMPRILAISACNFSDMSAGRFLGPHNPYHETNSNPVTPDSSTVGISGAAADRLRLVRRSEERRVGNECRSGRR